MHRRGFTLVEVAVSALVVAILSVSMISLMSSTGKQIQRTDTRREARYLLRDLLDRIEAADFLTLYQNFGVEPEVKGRIREGLYRPAVFVDGERVPEYNPLNLTRRQKEHLEELGWKARLEFRFMTREELGASVLNEATSLSGVLHLQAGWIELLVEGPELPPQRVLKPVFCPLVLGRPGLMLSQCPATNEGLKRELLEEIP
jgi:prepilin-type N-terminal cleavage/methylation domain-containing protein